MNEKKPQDELYTDFVKLVDNISSSVITKSIVPVSNAVKKNISLSEEIKDSTEVAVKIIRADVNGSKQELITELNNLQKKIDVLQEIRGDIETIIDRKLEKISKLIYWIFGLLGLIILGIVMQFIFWY